jgi:hypothetical protein
VLLGTAFSTMTALLAVHALATPGVLIGPNGVVALAGGASLPMGAAVLALTALPALRRPRHMGRLLVLQAGLAAGVVVLGVIGMLVPSVVPAVPERGTAAAIVLIVVGVALFGLLGHRALRTFALTRRFADLVVAVACAWLALATFASLTATPGAFGFYLGHALELAGVVLLALVGYEVLYLNGSPTFGANFSDYFGVLVWGLGADVAARTITALGRVPAR